MNGRWPPPSKDLHFCDMMVVACIPGIVQRHPSFLQNARVLSIATANSNSHATQFASCTVARKASHATASSSAPETPRSRATAIQSIDACLFPELVTKPDRKRTLVAIDPDSNGAVSTFTWPASSISSHSSPRYLTLVEMLRSADIEVHDMPTEPWQLRNREKKRPSARAIQRILQPLIEDSDIVRIAVEFSTPTHLSGKFAWYDSGYASGTYVTPLAGCLID